MKIMPPRGNTRVGLPRFSIFTFHFIIMAAVYCAKTSLASVNGRLGSVVNVQKYGAVGDGKHDSTKAFERAWDVACKKSFSTMLVPANKKFVVNNLVLQGPCEPGFIFKVDGKIVAHKSPAKWKNSNIWLQFDKLENFNLMGKGTIDGQGNSWWPAQCNIATTQKYCNSLDRPSAINFNGCNGVIIKGLSLVNSPKFHLTLTTCENIQILGLTIKAPETSPNTDGIDIFGSKNILIQHSSIGTGDDCIGIGTGSKNIVIKNVTCGPGHGISIGSLGRENSEAEVSNVTVDGAKFIGTQNGLRIKTWQGGSGFARDIKYENIQMINAGNPIIIDQYYCFSPYHCKNQTSAVAIKNVTYKNVSGTSATPTAVKLECSKSVPCRAIKLSNISLKLTSGDRASSVIENAHGHTTGYVNPECFPLRH